MTDEKEKKDVNPRQTIDWDGKEVDVILGKALFGPVMDLIYEAIEMKSKGGDLNIEIKDITKYMQYLLLASIKEAPFEITVENIRKLTAEDGFKLFYVSQELNPLVLA